jgi:glycerophosphoryl diester phosphodiesterase
MTRTFPASLLRAPIAHRALHDVRDGRPENSRAAIRAAVAAGYGIEIDIQLSADGQAMVFHDYDLSRLTLAKGTLRSISAETLGEVQLIGGDEGIPRLDEVLRIVAGQVPLLIEIKDQDGALGPDVGELEAAVAAALDGYGGDVALMSFNPHSVAALQTLLPERPRGLTTEAFLEADEWKASRERLAALERISDYERVGACFISHNHRQLAMPRVAELKADGAAVLCWTIRSPEDEAIARRIADNVTFEGYLP